MATVPAWFDVTYYLDSKAAKDVPAKASGDEVRAELAAAGYVGDEGIFQHYNDWGVKEGLYPSAALEGFNEDAYLAAKAAHDAEVSGQPAKTVEELKTELANANMSAIDHYLAYNESEGTNYVPGEGAVTPEVPGTDNTDLATALQDLVDARDAQDEYLEGLGELDHDFDEDTDPQEATADVVTGMLTTTAGTLAGNEFTGLSADKYNDITKTDLQDADIADAKAEAQKAVDEAAEAAPEGAMALVEAVNQEEEAYQKLLDAKAEAVTAYKDAEKAFLAVNDGADQTPDLSSFTSIRFENDECQGNDGTVIATKGEDGKWVLEQAYENARGLDDLVAAYDANSAAHTAAEKGLESLQDAVEAVYLAEYGGEFVSDFGSSIVVTADEVAVDLDADDVVISGVAEEDVVDPTAATFTITVTTALGDGETLKIGDLEITGDATTATSPAETATAIQGATLTGTALDGWTATVDDAGTSVTFTAPDTTTTVPFDAADVEVTGVQNSATGILSVGAGVDGDAGSTKETFELTISTALATGEKIQFGDVVTDAVTADATTANDQAAALFAQNDQYGDWTVTSVTGAVVTFTYKDATNVDDPTTADIVVVPVTPSASGAVSFTSTGAGAGSEVISTAADSKSAALKGALDNQAALLDAIDNYLAAREMNVELDTYATAIEDAEKAITDPVEDGGLGISLLENADNFTSKDDVYLFSAAQTLDNFGAKGLDKIFFGKDYNFVALEGKDIAAEEVGEVSALEIFWEETSDGDLKLYVEDKAFGGSATGLADITELTLTGVESADVAFADGFLTAGTASA